MNDLSCLPPPPNGRVAVDALRVLVAADDFVLSRSLRGHLDALGCKVVAGATSGSEALTRFADLLPDLVLIDLGLPGTPDGVETALRMREQWPVPIIFLAGKIDSATLARAKSAKPAGYLRKPVDPDEVHWMLEFALNCRSLDAERRQMLQTLRDSEARFRGILESAADGVLVTDPGGRIALVNQRLQAMFGYAAEELVGQDMEILLPERFRAGHRHHHQSSFEHFQPRPMGTGLALYGRHRDGGEFPVDVSLCATEVAGERIVTAFVQDKTRERAAENELKRLNRSLRLLNRCNEALVRAPSEQALLEAVCRYMAELGGYRLAFVGFAESPAASRVTPAVWAGPGSDYLACWSDEERGRGSSGETIRSGKPCIARDIASDPNYHLWRDQATRHGLAASIALPLLGDGLYGCLRVFAEEADAFNAQEMELLSELADDLTYGILTRRAGEALRLRERAIEASAEAIMITDALLAEHPITYVNPAFERITGYSAAAALGQNGRFLLGGDLEQSGLTEIRAALRAKRDGQALLRCRRRNGSLLWAELSVSPVRDAGDQVTHFVSIMNDVSERKQYEEQLEYQASFDLLTGLANRNLLADRLGQALLQAGRSGRVVGVLLLDLDRFKVVNETLGHEAGNTLLKTVATRLRGVLREGDTGARLGADEFVAVLADLAHPEDAALVAHKVLDALAEPLQIGGQELFASASIGISLYPRDGDNVDALLKNADAAMYRAKEEGRNDYRFYAHEMNARAIERLAMETALRRAAGNGELELYYQPKVSLDSGRIVGAEALLRWHHPERGLVSPAEFIPIAEDTGLIVPIGAWVLETACARNQAWRDAGLPPVSVAVNLSARQFGGHDISTLVGEVLGRTGLDAGALELEITESLIMHDVEGAALVLRRLKDAGVRIAIDDFGTGYSSLAYLKRFTVDTLKIDRSFVRDLTVDSDDAAIAGAIIAMARSLRFSVIAEGVETTEQLAFLRANGCDEIQGYYFSRPVPAAEFEALLAAGKRLSW